MPTKVHAIEIFFRKKKSTTAQNTYTRDEIILCNIYYTQSNFVLKCQKSVKVVLIFYHDIVDPIVSPYIVVIFR